MNKTPNQTTGDNLQKELVFITNQLSATTGNILKLKQMMDKAKFMVDKIKKIDPTKLTTEHRIILKDAVRDHKSMKDEYKKLLSAQKDNLSAMGDYFGILLEDINEETDLSVLEGGLL